MTDTAGNEQSSVENAVVHQTQTDNLDRGSNASNGNHLLASEVKVIVEVSVGAPSTPLTKVMKE